MSIALNAILIVVGIISTKMYLEIHYIKKIHNLKIEIESLNEQNEMLKSEYNDYIKALNEVIESFAKENKTFNNKLKVLEDELEKDTRSVIEFENYRDSKYNR